MIEDVEPFFSIFEGFKLKDIHDFLCALLLELGFDPKDLTPDVEALLADFARRAGTTPESVGEYFKEHPLNPELVKKFKATIRTETLAAAPGLLARSTAKWLAGDPARKPEPIRAGAIGRATFRKKK